MPPLNPLPQSTIDIVRQWITDGALDDRVVVLDPVRITSVSPAPGAILAAQPAQIVAGFDRDLDAATVNTLTFILEASTDGTFDNGDDVQIMSAGITLPTTTSAQFDLTGVVLADDIYRVRLLGDGLNVIMDTDANALDGENLGIFPSGDGTAGGDWASQFTISTPPVLMPNLDSIQQFIFTPRCASCHSGVMPSGSLDLSDADTSFVELVNIAAANGEAFLRVAPTDPDMSYLIIKLEGNQVIGTPMPPPLGGLPQADIDVVRDWITNGALRN